MESAMDWQEALSDAIGYIGQETLEYAVEMMTDASEDDDSLHQTWIRAFDEALSQCRAGNKVVLSVVNRFTVQAGTLPCAQRLIEELQQLYLREYQTR